MSVQHDIRFFADLPFRTVSGMAISPTVRLDMKRTTIAILILSCVCGYAFAQTPALYVPSTTSVAKELPPAAILTGSPPPEFRLPLFSSEQRAVTEPIVQRPRVGMNRPLLGDALKIGEWIKDAGGQVHWRLRIKAEGATGIRIHFAYFSVGSGKVWIHDGTGIDQVFGPYTGKGWFGDGEFWTEMVFGDFIDLEYSPEKPIEVLPFQITEIFQYWIGTLDKPAVSMDSIATDCFLDAVCYDNRPYIHSEALATVYLMMPDGFACTGTMINDRNSANSRYLLTAGHCINSESNARGLLVVFAYNTDSCIGNFAGWGYQLNPRRLPQVSGATLLKWSVHFGSSSGTLVFDAPDFAFLQLSQQPPAAFIYSGWSWPTNIGETLYSVSHPRNLPNAYARGLVTANLVDDFFLTSMVEGRADHGSSGSGIFDGNVHLRGVLSAGSNKANVSACTESSNEHSFTRFSSIYPQISQWLDKDSTSLDKTPPQLTITSHYDGQTVSGAPITLSGTGTDAGLGDSGISSVTVNGIRANADTSSSANTANWSRTFLLSNGANTITVIAKDNSSNQNATMVTITINLSIPPPPPTSTYHVFPQVVDGQSGGFSYISLITITNLTGVSASCSLSGLPVSRFTLDPIQTIPSNSTLVNGTSGKGFFTTGYATLYCSQPVQASLSYFSIGPDDTTFSMATVFSAPPITYATIPVFSGIGWRYGIAIANTNASTISVNLYLNTSKGQLMSTTVQIAGRSQYVGFVDQLLNLPSAAGLNIFEVTSASPFSVTALLFDGAVFTTIVPATRP